MNFEIQGRLGLTYALLATVLAGLTSTCHAEPSDIEDMSAHMQLTYNWQKHPAFSAPYTGPNSILPIAEKMYTFTTTAFLGFRPWLGGEFYLTPEISVLCDFEWVL